MSAAENVVGIHGVPRSGTSWLGQLFNSCPTVAYRYQPFFSYAFRNRVEDTSSRKVIRAFFSDLLDTADPFVLQVGEKKLAADTPIFEKVEATHLVYKEVRFHHLLPRLLDALPTLKVVGIVRNPCAVISSWQNAPREFDPTWSIETEWLSATAKNRGLAENWFGFQRWVEMTMLLHRLAEASPSRVTIIRYEALRESPEKAIRDVFDFCGLNFSPQSARFIEESTSRSDGDHYGVHRDHRDVSTRSTPISADIRRQIEQTLRGTAMARYLG